MKIFYRIIRYTILFSITISLIIISILFIPCRKQDTFYEADNKIEKIWAHRGYSINSPENSIESVKAALPKGFKGVEIDVRFNKTDNCFYLSHDKIKNYKNLTTLDSLFSHTGDGLYYWLDLKNLNEENKKQIVDKLKALSVKYEINRNIIIESRNANALYTLTKNGFHTSLWLKDPYPEFMLRFIYNNINNKIKLFLYTFNAVSFDSRYINKTTLQIYKNCNIHTWRIYTTNYKTLIPILNINSVKIILFDGDNLANY